MILNLMLKSASSQLTKPVYIDAAVRSPIGKFGGTLKNRSAPKLAAEVLKAALQKFPDFSAPEIVFMGHARQAGAGPNPARQAVCFSGLSESIPAITVNQACASGIAALIAGVEKIGIGKAKSVWSGGVESMSNTPYLLPKARWGMKFGNGQIVDGMHQDGFHCPMADMVMGMTVEKFLAQELKISRREQDEFALHSQKQAVEAWSKGFFKEEILSIVPEGKEPGLDKDEHFRADTTLEKLESLPPVFDAKTGTVTAGNSSGITDGAAWLHLSTEKNASALAEILDYEVVALDPKRMGLGPVPATEKLLKRQNLAIGDLEAVELNEAFAAQVIACQRQLKIPAEKLNAWGGSIALGHPIGATGARITVTLLSRLKGKPGALGLATLCVSGGQGVSLLVRSLK